MSSGGKLASPKDDYDDVCTPRSAADLRIFMSDGMNVSKVEGDAKGKRKRGGLKRVINEIASSDHIKGDQHVYDEGVDTGFEMFRKYAKVIDPKGDWEGVTIEEARALLGEKKPTKGLKRKQSPRC
ncbi:hypothetical protein M0R45_019684 [Rubus argutus]|uniref:Uncharacterized protein n=1 Tax=Rubus argutus TaxID=59490 RepID=A0AAW1X630_RUBAR